MALEAKFAKILKLDTKDQTPRIAALVDEVVASAGLAALQALSLKLLAEDMKSEVSKAAILHLSSSLASLPGEVFYEIACFLITNLKSHPSYDDSDFILRDAVFNHCIGCEEYTEAAQTLAGANLESTTRPFSCPEKVDIFIKCAEAVLEADEAIDAEVFVNKASALINDVDSVSLQLRYKVTYARVMDANRKFVEAALRYCELSSTTANVVQEELLELLGKAVTCAILSKTGPQRGRVLGLLVKDERLAQLDCHAKYSAHSNVLRKMHNEQILRKSELAMFEESLMPHQKATAGDGHTILDKAVMEHNMTSMARIYDNITFQQLGLLLSLDPQRAEKVAAAMITEDRLKASIDQTEDLLIFEGGDDSFSTWDRGIEEICSDISEFADIMEQRFVRA
mmetsp:Transcript_21775/g.48460  ORF Transcript_21775/g.48460 Transcript_21775/m.48460 type:complete len:397 (-) Transcript_21775:233-1423(-)